MDRVKPEPSGSVMFTMAIVVMLASASLFYFSNRKYLDNISTSVSSDSIHNHDLFTKHQGRPFKNAPTQNIPSNRFRETFNPEDVVEFRGIDLANPGKERPPRGLMNNLTMFKPLPPPTRDEKSVVRSKGAAKRTESNDFSLFEDPVGELLVINTQS